MIPVAVWMTQEWIHASAIPDDYGHAIRIFDDYCPNQVVLEAPLGL